MTTSAEARAVADHLVAQYAAGKRTAGHLRVAIRRDIGRDVRPGAEQLDGRVFVFIYGWMMEDDDPYPGEVAMIPDDPTYPVGAPHWIASGDLMQIGSAAGGSARSP